jgi:hypothetical protein
MSGRYESCCSEFCLTAVLASLITKVEAHRWPYCQLGCVTHSLLSFHKGQYWLAKNLRLCSINFRWAVHVLTYYVPSKENINSKRPQ